MCVEREERTGDDRCSPIAGPRIDQCIGCQPGEREADQRRQVHANTGDAPSHSAGATITAGTISGSAVLCAVVGTCSGLCSKNPTAHLPSPSVMPVAHNPGNRSEGAVSRATGEIPERLLWAWLVLALLMAALACYRIATQSIVLGSAEGRWVYRYLQPFSVRILLTGVSVAAASCVLLLSDRITGRYTWRTVFVWVLLAVALQAVLRSLTPYTFERIFVSDGANSFFSVTQRYYAYTTLVDFDRVRQYWPLHAQSNMPGKLLVIYALRQISTRPDVLRGWWSWSPTSARF